MKIIKKILDIPFFYNLTQKIFDMDFPQVAKAYIEKFPHNTILEIGCGTGKLTELIGLKNYLGIDINKGYIDFAKNKYEKKGINFLLTDAKKINKIDKSFDLILMLNVLHHLSKADLDCILKRLKENIRFKRIIVMDSKPDIDPFSKILENLDQGHNFRELNEIENIFRKYFLIKKSTVIRKPYWLYKYPTIVAEKR